MSLNRTFVFRAGGVSLPGSRETKTSVETYSFDVRKSSGKVIAAIVC